MRQSGICWRRLLTLSVLAVLVTCAKQSDEVNECVVVDGGLIIYADGNMVANDEESVLEAIKKGMENGDFNKDPVKRVSYVDLDAPSVPSSQNDGQGTQNTPMRRGVLFGLVVGFATLLLILSAVVWRRRNKDTDAETSDSLGDGATSDV